jgi:hypothetical protein
MANMCVVDWTAIGTLVLAAVGVVSIVFLETTRRATVDSAAATRAQNELLKAQLEAATRPILALKRHFGVWFVENQGTGSAHTIHWWKGGQDDKGQELIFLNDGTFLAAGRKVPIDFSPVTFAKTGIVIEYQANDADKTSYRTVVQVTEGIEGTLFQQLVRVL